MSLPNEDILLKSLQRFYGDLSGASTAARRVGWESDAAHNLRMGAICEQLQPLVELGDVLDAGCGEGRLLEMLRLKGFRGGYRGEDLLQHHIDAAATMFRSDDRAEFACTNTFGGDSLADIVICSGTLNTRATPAPAAQEKFPGGVDMAHETLVGSALRALWARTRDTLVVDLAILDRHPPGVGIGRVRMSFVHELLRSMAPAVSVHEDGVLGEALFVASRFRRRGASRRLSEAAERAEVLIAAGDGAGALKALDAGDDAGRATRQDLLRAAALAMMGELLKAEQLLEAILPLATADVDAVRVGLAPVKWRLGKKTEARALLEEAAARSDEARTHLAQLLAGTGDRDGARQVIAAIEDAWTRRELERELGTAP